MKDGRTRRMGRYARAYTAVLIALLAFLGAGFGGARAAQEDYAAIFYTGANGSGESFPLPRARVTVNPSTGEDGEVNFSNKSIASIWVSSGFRVNGYEKDPYGPARCAFTGPGMFNVSAESQNRVTYFTVILTSPTFVNAASASGRVAASASVPVPEVALDRTFTPTPAPPVGFDPEMPYAYSEPITILPAEVKVVTPTPAGVYTPKPTAVPTAVPTAKPTGVPTAKPAVPTLVPGSSSSSLSYGSAASNSASYGSGTNSASYGSGSYTPTPTTPIPTVCVSGATPTPIPPLTATPIRAATPTPIPATGATRKTTATPKPSAAASPKAAKSETPDAAATKRPTASPDAATTKRPTASPDAASTKRPTASPRQTSKATPRATPVPSVSVSVTILPAEPEGDAGTVPGATKAKSTRAPISANPSPSPKRNPAPTSARTEDSEPLVVMPAMRAGSDSGGSGGSSGGGADAFRTDVALERVNGDVRNAAAMLERGDTVTYRVRVTNTGDTKAKPERVEVLADARLSLPDAEAAGWTQSQGSVSRPYSGDAIPPGEYVEYSLNLVLNESVPQGERIAVGGSQEALGEAGGEQARGAAGSESGLIKGGSGSEGVTARRSPGNTVLLVILFTMLLCGVGLTASAFLWPRFRRWRRPAA